MSASLCSPGPYYKPYHVGWQEYRGANARDFSGINELDLLPGVSRAKDPHCAQLLVDKMPFMLTVEQLRPRECMTCKSLLGGLPGPLPHRRGADCHFSNNEEDIERFVTARAAQRVPSAPLR